MLLLKYGSALKNTVLGILAAGLVACGGGGGGSAEVIPLPALPAPTISAAPASTQVVAGEPVTFSVTTTGQGLTYVWQRAGAAIVGAPSASTYTLPSTTLADNGAQIQVVVSNATGSVISAAATLTVVAPAAPVISSQPAGVQVAVGQAATFSVTASGTGLTYVWQRAGAAIVGAPSAPSYSLPNAALADNGAKIRVVVSNSGGSVSSSEATLSVVAVLVAPTISQQPQPVSVVEGQTATFSATIDGTLPITYQWQRNGVDIPGARLVSNEALPITYSLQSTVLADSGARFRVKATNSAGEITTSEVALTVTPRP